MLSKSPRQILFLADKEVGSASEALLFAARQSKKVKIMGTPTYSVLDYASARGIDLKLSNRMLVLPTNRSVRLPEYPIDNIGIQPDIY